MAAVYPINVFWSDEDGAWMADVPDCSATGDTPHEAVSEVEVAIEAWLEAARSTGRTIPAPSARAVHAYAPRGGVPYLGPNIIRETWQASASRQVGAYHGSQ